MAPSDRERLDRERLDADRRYNAALTDLDRAVTRVTSQAGATSVDLGQVATALIVFLQQITAFVETKDRALAADTSGRVDALSPALESIAELRTQIGVVQRAIEMLKRAAAGPESAISNPQSAIRNPESAIRNPQSAIASNEYKYLGFEDAFRGSDQLIAERLRVYVPIFAGGSDVLDIGCGRGELLSALEAAGVTARGVDANTEMVAVARERGLDVSQADALSYLAALPDGSLGGIIATQVIEHLEPAYLVRLIETAAQKLRPGSPIVLETINPTCWLAFFSSYLRDFTHTQPVHPETLQYLLRANGFTRVEIRYSSPVPDHTRMKTIDLPAEVLASSDATAKALAQVARSVNANAVVLNTLMFSHMDYAVVGYRS